MSFCSRIRTDFCEIISCEDINVIDALYDSKDEVSLFKKKSLLKIC